VKEEGNEFGKRKRPTFIEGTLFIMSVYATVSELVISVRQSNHDGKDEKN
jgi:hypothetical protein